MKINMGTLDRILRFAIALSIPVLFYLDVITGNWATVLLVLAAVFLITSFIGSCPLYIPFSINTRKKRKQK